MGDMTLSTFCRPVRFSALLALACTVSITAAACGSKSNSSPAPGTTVEKASVWSLPNNISGAVTQAGLPLFGNEQLAVHYHVHLDVLVDGQPITVPQGIGIDNTAQKISPLHTHDTTGVIHIESA